MDNFQASGRRMIVIIIHDGKGQRRYRVPHLLAGDLETWLRWAEKHGGAEVEEEQATLFPLQEVQASD